MLEDLRPQDLGLPAKFAHFRPIQDQMVQYALYGPGGCERPSDSKRFTLLGAPPGSGKSVAAHTIGRLSGGKYAVLTVSLTLADQYLDDEFDVQDIRGRKNYDCLATPEQLKMEFAEPLKCDQGQDEGCPYAGTGACRYRHTVELAKNHQDGISTNYAYWMSARINRAALEQEGGVNPIRTLICDEAHMIPNELSRHLSAWVSLSMVRLAGRAYNEAVATSKGEEWGKVGEKWLIALGSVCARLESQLAEIADDYESATQAQLLDKNYRKLSKLLDSLVRIVRLGTDGNWIWHWAGHGIQFDCIWPRRYAEMFLWQGIPRIVLMSGTLRPKTASLLGIRESERRFKEWPNVFPKHMTPIYWIKTGKIGKKHGDDGLYRAVGRFNEIFDIWADEHDMKGIVHTLSYKQARWLKDHSPHHERMYLNDPEKKDTQEVARRFREQEHGCALVSPSYGTGHSFEDETCRWIMIPQLPWLNRGDPIVQARCADDETYYNAETMAKLVQECYRGTRHEKDPCTVMITDDSINGFRWYAKDYAPAYFSVMERDEVPRPGGIHRR